MQSVCSDSSRDVEKWFAQQKNTCLDTATVISNMVCAIKNVCSNSHRDLFKKRMGILTDFEGEKAHQICSFMWADNFWIMSHSKKNLEQMLRDLIEEASRGIWYLNQRVCGGQARVIPKRGVTDRVTPHRDATNSFLRRSSRSGAML